MKKKKYKKTWGGWPSFLACSAACWACWTWVTFSPVFGITVRVIFSPFYNSTYIIFVAPFRIEVKNFIESLLHRNRLKLNTPWCYLSWSLLDSVTISSLYLIQQQIKREDALANKVPCLKSHHSEVGVFVCSGYTQQVAWQSMCVHSKLSGFKQEDRELRVREHSNWKGISNY